MITIGIFIAAMTALAAYLDIRSDAVNSSCISGKPSTAVAAWSWFAFPFVAAWGFWG